MSRMQKMKGLIAASLRVKTLNDNPYSKFVDPEAAFERDSAYNNFFYPWPKTIMFGIDLTF